MAARWNVLYGNGRSARHHNCEGRIVDTFLIFVNEDPGFRRFHNAVELVVCSVSGKVGAFPKRLTHGKTADPRLPRPPGIDKTCGCAIRRAVINVHIIEILENLPSRQKERISAAWIKSHVSTAPIGGRLGNRSGIHAVVIQIRSPVVVVTRIHDPAQRQLFCVVQTRDCLGPLLCLAQGWQEQAGQDGDDRDDHQQFN